MTRALSVILKRRRQTIGEDIMTIEAVGAICFGLVIGWVTYRTLRRQDEQISISNLASVIGAVGGGAVTALLPEGHFSWYAIGLAAGFFSYVILGATLFKSVDWLGDGS